MSSLGIIFDCDGTLLDSMELWHSLDDRIAVQAGVELTKADRDYLTACTLEECGIYFHEQLGVGVSAAAVMEAFDEELMRFYRDEVTLKPGARALVQELAQAQVPMAVASSTPPHLLRVGLERAGLADAMEAIISVEDIQSSKREPLVYDTAREALGTTRERTWGVEDALYAVRTLNGAGYRTLAVFDSMTAGTPEELTAEADLFVPSLEDVSLTALGIA